MGKFINSLEEHSRKWNISEISHTTFKGALDVSRSRGTDRRTYKLGQLYFDKFMGNSLMGGVITDIGTQSPNQGNYRIVSIEVEKSIKHDSGYYKGEVEKTKDYIYYDVVGDEYNLNDEISRRDAVMLSKIAQHINPDTKYKETGKHFKIVGW